MEKVTIYHNPKCSKSRATLKLLQERGVDLEIVEYLLDPPDAQALDIIAHQLDLEPGEFIRTKEDEFAELELDAAVDDREKLLAAMASHPILIERPIVVAGDRARLGRPPEQVLEIL
tara:strand:- start:412 stop:762 length:351 start_codon:yes stop_codon:yes gene_type:complete